mgnify:CR=1 FL=1
MVNNQLAIAIPTYNRHLILKENLLAMLPDLKKYNIPVYISDDSDNNHTRDMIIDFKIQYDNIFYFKNYPSLGHDKNCLKTLGIPNEEYIWYLGDSQIIKNQSIETILNLVEKNTFDFILVNAENRNVDIPSQYYSDANDFFVDLAWHATLTGVTIYRKEILFRKNYTKYIGSNFIQLGIILEELLENTDGLYWLNNKMMDVNKNKAESYWAKEIFKVFAEDWFDLINDLPKAYLYENKLQVLKSHSYHTGLFKFKNFITLRKRNILNLKSYLKVYRKLKYTTSLNIHTVFLIALQPRFILIGASMMLKKIKIDNLKLSKFRSR